MLIVDIALRTGHNIAGRLKHFAKNWSKLTNDPVSLEIIEHRLENPFIENPPQTDFRQFRSNESQKTLIAAEIEIMLEKGVEQFRRDLQNLDEYQQYCSRMVF